MASSSRAAIVKSVRWGLIGGAVSVYLAVVGIVQRFQSRDVIVGVIGIGRAVLAIVALAFGYLAARGQPHTPGEPESPRPESAATLVAGAVAGAVTGAVLGLFVLAASAVELRSVLVSVTEPLLDTLSFGQAATLGALLLTLLGAALGAVGAATHLLQRRVRAPLFAGVVGVLTFSLFSPLIRQVLFSLFVPTDLFYEGDGLTIAGTVIVFVAVAAMSMLWKSKGDAPRRRVESMAPQQRKLATFVVLAAVVGVLLYLPQILGIFLSEVLGTIGLFVLMGIGLNIVVGYAGLLDLGYVAFFAIGAYATGILTAPEGVGSLELSFWVAMPIVVAFSTICGVLIGAPVLRLRGDYLAIVTLGFGEIARIFVISNWAAPVTGGAQGILSIPDPTLGGFAFDDSQTIYYPILIACLIAAFISARLADSRVGRAWNAMREDESVAEAMGISIIRYKLLAFGMGAAIGSFGGQFFAAKIGSIFPASFNILVSIQVLSLIVLGGMGSIRGVIVGAAVLVGLPELLREFAEFRLLFYGAILVAIMLLRPQGLLPSERRKRELAVEGEEEEEQYEMRAGGEAGAPAVAGGAGDR